jgi:hypothetical protein
MPVVVAVPVAYALILSTVIPSLRLGNIHARPT